ncbi:MAG: InlB B-repeat-containing protein [Bifidobacterium pseudocatenulatum]
MVPAPYMPAGPVTHKPSPITATAQPEATRRHNPAKTGDELTTNANGFTRDGYTFVRWDTAKDGSGTAYGEGKNGVSQYVMKPAGNDLYAIWKANPATIQYRNDWPNTTGSTPDTTGNTGDTVTISQNSFDRPGYTFTGWSTSKRGDPSLQPGDKHTLEPRTTHRVGPMEGRPRTPGVQQQHRNRRLGNQDGGRCCRTRP